MFRVVYLFFSLLSSSLLFFFSIALFCVDCSRHHSKNAMNGLCWKEIAEPMFLYVFVGGEMKTQTFHGVDINLITLNKTEAKMRDR